MSPQLSNAKTLRRLRSIRTGIERERARFVGMFGDDYDQESDTPAIEVLRNIDTSLAQLDMLIGGYAANPS